tara:strand:+ start:144 stop:701 length:558 start_codon:yes stop_codon:yes gene_type:complete
VNKLYVILLCLPALLFGQQTVIKEIKINPYMYTQNYEHFKRIVLDSPNSEAEYVDGFDFEWGYFYTLKVKEIDLGELSDGTRYEYSLLKVISKQQVADTFVFGMYIDPLRYYSKIEDEGVSNYTLNKLNDSVYLYMDNIEIEIPEMTLEFISKKRENKSAFMGYFQFVNGNRIRLKGFRAPLKNE